MNVLLIHSLMNGLFSSVGVQCYKKGDVWKEC